MEGIGQLETHQWNPLALFGIDIPFLKLNSETIIATWVVIGALCGIIALVRFGLQKQSAITRYGATEFVAGFKNLCTETMGTYLYKHFAFITAMFMYVLACNWISIIPGVEEPTKDLNTALALGLCTFIYKEYYAIKSHGFKAYLAEFTHPFALMFPLNVVGHYSKLISISFRLFGNIFGGSIITAIYLGFISSSPILEVVGLFGFNYIVLFFFTLFEGLIQAFVFAMLSLTYLSIALQGADEGVAD